MKRNIIVCTDKHSATNRLFDLFSKFGEVSVVTNEKSFQLAVESSNKDFYFFAYTDNIEESRKGRFLTHIIEICDLDRSYLINTGIDRINFQFTKILGFLETNLGILKLHLGQTVSCNEVFPYTPPPQEKPYTGQHVDWDDEKNYQAANPNIGPAFRPTGRALSSYSFLRPSVAYHYLNKST